MAQLKAGGAAASVILQMTDEQNVNLAELWSNSAYTLLIFMRHLG
jgi:hypothetical protein